GPAPALLERLQRLAIAYAHDPRAHARAAAEGAAAAPHDHHHVVHAFLRELELAGNAVDEAQQRVVVAAVERAQRLAVAVRDAGEQGRLDRVVVGRRSDGAVRLFPHRLEASRRNARLGVYAYGLTMTRSQGRRSRMRSAVLPMNHRVSPRRDTAPITMRS